MIAKQLICSVPGCGRNARGMAADKLMCGMHRQRWVKYGTSELPLRNQTCTITCAAPDCDRTALSPDAQYCNTHWYRLRRGSRDGLGPIRKTCAQCSKPLTKNQSRYCSYACGTRFIRGTPDMRACRICGTKFPTLDKTAFCSEQCRLDSKHARGHRMRALIRGISAEKFSRTEIFERDGWRCQVCGKKVRRDVNSKHPLYPSLDHITPLAKGGTHTRVNVQCVHLSCNFTKQARLIGQLRLFG